MTKIQKALIDFHSHSILSDGELVPAELARRAEDKGYHILGITDHADMSNLDLVVPRIAKFAKEWNKVSSLQVIAGVELTHIPPSLIAGLVKEARSLGARLVLVHGETIVEPVAEGTNRAALKAKIDILAHPGRLTREEAEIARREKVSLEISSREGHCLTNGWVAAMAREMGVPLTLGSDTHDPADLLTWGRAEFVCQGAGLDGKGREKVFANGLELARRVMEAK